MLGLLLHLYNFWYNMQFAEIIGNHELGPFPPADGAAYIAALFSSPVYCIIYLVWFAAIWFHLTHGILERCSRRSAGTTRRGFRRLKRIAERRSHDRVPLLRARRDRVLSAQPRRLRRIVRRLLSMYPFFDGLNKQ